MAPVKQVSASRLNIMRAGYLLLFAGLGYSIWPGLLQHEGWSSSRESASCLLAALSLLAVIGIRYPLEMTPLLFFELTWKTIWLVTIGLPRWVAHDVDANTSRMAITCLAALAVCPLLIPWPYVFKNYVLKPGDRWR